MKNVLALLLLVGTVAVYGNGNPGPKFNNHVDPPPTLESFVYEHGNETLVTGLGDGARWFRVDTTSGEVGSQFYHWFDEDGRLYLYTGYRKDGYERNFYMDVYEYDELGRVTLHRRKRGRESTETYEYDADGRMTVRDMTYESDPGWVYHFTYDNLGNLTKEERLDRETGNNSTTECTYDENGNAIRLTVHSTEEGVTTHKRTAHYTYREGLLILVSGSDGAVINELEYDDQGRRVAELTYRGETLTDEVRHGYDQAGNRTLYVNVNHGFNWGSEWYGKREWEYDSQGRMVENREYYEKAVLAGDGYSLDAVTVYSYEPDMSRAVTYKSDRTRVTRDVTRTFFEGRLVSIIFESFSTVVPGSHRTERRYSYEAESGVIRSIVEINDDGDVESTTEIRFGFDKPAETSRM